MAPDHRLEERDRPWVMRTYAGHSTASASNALYRKLGVGEGRPLRMRVGAAEITIDPRTVQPESEVLDFQLHLLPQHGPATAVSNGVQS